MSWKFVFCLYNECVRGKNGCVLYFWPYVNGEKNVFIMNVDYQGMKMCVSA
jgi:hypothetical protein